MGEQLLDGGRLEAIRGFIDEVRQMRPDGLVPRQQPFLDELADDHARERLARRPEDERRVGRHRPAGVVCDAVSGQMHDLAAADHRHGGAWQPSGGHPLLDPGVDV